MNKPNLLIIRENLGGIHPISMISPCMPAIGVPRGTPQKYLKRHNQAKIIKHLLNNLLHCVKRLSNQMAEPYSIILVTQL